MDIIRSSLFMSVYKKIGKKVRYSWYELLINDARISKQPKLLKRFWAFYWSHRLTKNRAAYSVLKSYYSTTPLSDYLKIQFDLDHLIEVCQTNIWEIDDEL